MIGLVQWHVAQGSSPRMRGALIFFVVGVVCLGIIPADAGSTVQPPAASARRPGSSPRMRGAPTVRLRGSHSRRIIPADAGSTILAGQQWYSDGDHPRGCGEHNSFISISKVRLGSSPRMRGALGVASADVRIARIIPADAGSTSSLSSSGMARQDHPRGCGEHSSPGLTIRTSLASSPRMRGALRCCSPSTAAHRIIPADAGSTQCTGQGLRCSEDHPRGCGEHGTLTRPRRFA